MAVLGTTNREVFLKGGPLPESRNAGADTVGLIVRRVAGPWIWFVSGTGLGDFGGSLS